LKQVRPAYQTCLRGRGHCHHDEIGKRVQGDRDQSQHHELECGRAAGRIQKLGDEGEKERRCLRIQGFDQHAVAERPSCFKRDDPLRQRSASFTKCLDAEPDQIKRAGEFDRRKQLSTGEDDRRDAECPRDHMHQSAQRRPERRGDTGFAATR